MPYKHIAAHLKKTELACRLHYHQLSHGSNRRKRTTSVSSGSSSGHSPLMPLPAQSPIHEAPTSRSASPPGSATSSYAPASPRTSLQLPSIMAAHGDRLPAILPKPAAMTLPPLSTGTSPTRSYPTPLPEPHSAALPPSATFPPLSAHAHPTTPPLRLECPVVLPPPSSARHHHHAHIVMARLQAVYGAHRASFWAAVAADYGGGVGAAALEQAWRAGGCCGGSQQQQMGSAAPLTPAASPESDAKDRTRISAILGMEAHPRSPQDQQMVRRMEEERCVVAASA